MSDELNKWIVAQTGLSKLYVHDFKNPISAISANLSYLEAVIDDDADEDVMGAVTDSSVALKTLLHMIDNFLQISRLEAGEKQEPVPVPLNRFMEEVLAKIKKMFTHMEPSLTVRTLVPDEMCFWPVAHMKLAVENMILSAMHNTPSSGKVFLDVRVVDSAVEFIVSDNGVPISSDYFSCSFDREFQMVAKSNEHARYGRALALYAVGLAAKDMQGDVRVDRVENLQRCVLNVPVEVPL